MNLRFYQLSSDVPGERVRRPGLGYDVVQSDAGPDDALAYFDRLIYPSDSFLLEVPDYTVEFWKEEQAIWVEIMGTEFWATSEVSFDEARAIIEALHRREAFGGYVPTTGREWDAYSLTGNGGRTR